MSTTLASSSSPGSHPTAPGTTTALRGALAGLEPRLRGILQALGAAELVALTCGAVLTAYALDRALELSFWTRAALLVAAAVLAARVYRRGRRRLALRFGIADLAAVAERSDAALDGQLVNALELPAEARRLEAGGATDLERTLAVRAAREAERVALAARERWGRSFDASVAWRWGAIALGGAALLIGVAASAPGSFRFWVGRGLLFSNEPWPRQTHFVLDREGDEWHLARKDPLEIAGWVAGEVPREIRARLESAGGTRVARVQPGSPGVVEVADARGTRDLEGRRLFHVLPAVTEPLVFRLEGGDNRTRDVRVLVHDRPRILAVRFHLRPPEYLAREPKTVENPGGDVTVPAGTEVEFEAESDQELGDGWVRFGKGEREPPGAVEGKVLRFTFKPEANGFLEVSVTGAEWGLSSEPPLRFGFVVVPDRAPAVRLALAGESRIATPHGKIAYRVEAEDDHGLSEVAFLRTARAPGDTRADEDLAPEKELLAFSAERGAEGVRAGVDGELALEPLSLAPGTALVLQAAATDNDALGGPKTVFSQKETILIVDLDDFRAEMERIRIEAQAALEDLARREDAVAEALADWKEEAGPGAAASLAAGAGSTGASARPGQSPAGTAQPESRAEGARESAPEPTPSAAPGEQGSSAATKAAAGGRTAASGKTVAGRKTAGGGKTAAGGKTAGGGKTAAGGKTGAGAKATSGAAGVKDGGRSRQDGSGPEGERSARDLAREQAAIGKETAAVGERLRDMAEALERNELLDPAEERRFRDEVEKEIERAAEERLPQSAAEIGSLAGAEDAEERARQASREAEGIADAMQKVADRLAGSGDFREVLFRLERILELQRRVIGVTEKGVSPEKKAESQPQGKEF